MEREGAQPSTWVADNGNGTFSNPLFYDEFSDPDLIRVGGDFYLTGTTNHAMPGLPVLHSRDLVNWRFLSYAFERLDLGPGFRLEGAQEIYGQGIWAPCFRYHSGTFYIFSNINRHHTQLFRARDPAGPWARSELNCSLHDLSVLFDDDGNVYVAWGYDEIKFARLNDALTDIVPGTERTIIPRGSGMGEGVHFYKIDGAYYISSAWFQGRMRMPCARAASPEGPYEVNFAISVDEDFGLAEGNRLRDPRGGSVADYLPPDPSQAGRMSLHQGGIVDTPAGEWWGFSMMDYNSVGRVTCLSPITWQEGWPYFGLPGNLRRTPRTWLKPNTGATSPPSAPYVRGDDFASPTLQPIWQWNHLPDDTKWSLTERPGYLRLHSLPATDFWWARNTLTQRAVGPVSIPTVELDASGLAPGDVAGLALLNAPYAWIGARSEANGLTLEHFDQRTGATVSVRLQAHRVWLRAHCDFLVEQATFSYSTDGQTFHRLGGEFVMIFQIKTFQGIRYALFHYNLGGAPGGYADFRGFTVDEPHPRGLMRPLPLGKTIALSLVSDGSVLATSGGHVTVVAAGDPLARSPDAGFTVVDLGLGRVALQARGSHVSVGRGQVTLRAGEPTDAETFQWSETPYGDLVLLSLSTHRYLRLEAARGSVTADHPGPLSGERDGVCLRWHER
jgi:beta-xylosidase